MRRRRGSSRPLVVLCPPHLAEQWQRELAEKFHIEAELVLSGTIQRLERDLPLGVSVFDRHRFTIVSTDFIKSARRAEDFILKCPEFVIVDEAHGCTLAGGVGRGRQQRFELLRRIAADASRHLLLVTATPHSGNEDAFRSLLSLLDVEFADLPTDLDRAGREGMLDLIRSDSPRLEEMKRKPVRMRSESADIEVGIHPEVLIPLLESRWLDARNFARLVVSQDAGLTYQPDGIAVVAGESWLRPFKDFFEQDI